MAISPQMESFLRVAKALSDANRVRILKMLQQKRMCVCEIREALGIAQPTASKHLKILTGAGLISWEKEGLWVNYSLSDGRSSPFAAVILGNLRHWLDDEPSVAELTNRLPLIRREDICGRR